MKTNKFIIVFQL